MRKVFKGFVVIILCVVLFACSKTQTNETKGIMDFNAEDFVQLGNYKGITVDEGFLSISEEELKGIVELELSSAQAFIEITDRTDVDYGDIVLLELDTGEKLYYHVSSLVFSEEFENELLDGSVGNVIVKGLENVGIMTAEIKGIYSMACYEDTDFVLNYYDVKSVDELNELIRNRAEEEIAFNYVFDKLCDDSIVMRYPDEILTQIEKEIKNTKDETLKQYDSFDDFLLKNEITEEQFNVMIESKYYYIMIYKSVLDNEGATVRIEEIDKYILDNNVGSEFSQYDVYEVLAQEKVRDIILDSIVIK